MSNLYLPEGFFVTTLSADINSSTTTIPLVAVPARVTTGYIVAEPSSGTKREVIHFTSVGVDSVTAADDTTDGSDASGRGCLGSITQGANTTHAQGATVIIAATEKYWKRLYDKLTGSDSDGIQLIEINDTNGNEQIKFVTTSSAVNEVTITNAATGNAPKVEATGGDTNIDLKLLPKGTGALSVTGTTDYETNVTGDDDVPNKKYVDDEIAAIGSSDGYILSADTWVYVSASSFKIEGADRTAVYRKGTLLKFTQTTAKYAVVTSSSFSTDTTINIAVNTDYTIANAAITSPFYSYQAAPQGFPAFFTSATMKLIGTGGSAGTYAQTTNTSKYVVQGNVCTVWCVLTLTNLGSWSGAVYLVMPIAPASTDSLGPIGQIIANGGLNTLKAVTANTSAASGGIIQWNKTMQTGELAWTDLATTDIVMLTGSYLI